MSSNKKQMLFTFPDEDGDPEDSILDGHCPQCKTQLVWTRKKFNMGVKAFFDICPTCLPENLKSLNSSQEAVQQIETLQRNLQVIADSEASMSRCIQRIQLELQFMIDDIEENDSTSTLDTSIYKILVELFATLLEEKAESLIEASALQQPPSLLDHVKVLHAYIVQLLNLYQSGGFSSESAYMYALIDVLKQLEDVRMEGDLEKSMQDKESLKEFQNEVGNLQENLQQVQNVLTDIPVLRNASLDISTLSDRYASLVQEMNTRHSDVEKDELRKKIEEIERQHAAEVEALRSQLDTILHTTLTANVIAVDPIITSVEQQHGTNSVVPPSDIQAEVVETVLPPRRGYSVMTVEAEPLQTFINTDAHALEKLNDIESVDGIFQIMEENPSSSRVQAAALNVLGILTQDRKQINDVGTDSLVNTLQEVQVEGNKQTIGSDKGILLILKAMRESPKDLNIQTHGLMLLGNIATNSKENAIKIGKLRGIHLILDGIREFPEDLKVQRNGLFAIYTLASNNFDLKTRIRELGGIATVVSAMRQYSEDFMVQRNGLAALGNLCSNNFKNRSVISEMGGIDIVLLAMLHFPDNAMIQDEACATIVFLAKSPDIRVVLRQRGAVTAVEKAVAIIGGSRSSAANALNALERDEQYL